MNNMKKPTDMQHQAMSSIKEESQAIGWIEYNYFKHKRNHLYIALEEVEDTDFFWSQQEIWNFDGLWEEDTPILEIAKEMRRSEIAVFLLSIDRIFQGEIKPRKGWNFW
jgi:hypothetical protein